MALNDILKHMPQMDYERKESASKELEVGNFVLDNRILAVPPFKHVSFL